MKKIIIRIVTALLVVFTFSFMTCNHEDWYYKHGFINNSDNGIIIAFSYNYPDTIPHFEEADMTDQEWFYGRYVAPHSTKDSMYFNYSQNTPLNACYGLYNDTVSFYIIDENVYRENGFFNVQLYYLVKLRYDLSKDDMKYLDYKLTYPPTPKMRGMKMYPPYEEAIKAEYLHRE
ncbi:MAG: hypothetical protein IKU35_04200 [Bacteroidaceae bacterium]|nr:hypothetical protein [Bacteroidaceae bacterium]